MVQRPIPHNWAAEQSSGEAVYVGDLGSVEGQLEIVPVLSARAHAKIKSMDFERAMKVPGE